MRTPALIAAVLVTGCGAAVGSGSDAVARGDARALGMHATERPPETRDQARLALEQDAWRREQRFVDAIDPGYLWRSSRPEQEQLEAGHYDNEQVFALGGQLFEIGFTPAVGYGSADLPTVAVVHTGLRGGPDARRCADCHHAGGLGGSGRAIDNALLRGDGVHVSSATTRNPPALAGAGLLELIARQITVELQASRNEAIAFAKEQGYGVRIPLTSQGIAFGHLSVDADGTVDTREVEGIDADLTIRPFGRKGRWSALRDVIEDELAIHHGMQSSRLAATGATDRIGDFGGEDPDGDGVVDEITEGQLTALTFFVAMLDMPQEAAPAHSTTQTLWARGRSDFEDLGCATCHVPKLALDSVQFRLPSREGGPTRRAFLDQEAAMPRIATASADGTYDVRLYSDLRRHDMGPALAESRPEGSVGEAVYITPPLWGVAVTGPYLHDGRAPTLEDAIFAHGGEASASAEAFAALPELERAPLRVFLTSLRRAPRLVAR
jgi:hypothetical protein